MSGVMFASSDSERPRVLAAIKPAQRGLPLPATRAREFAQNTDGEVLLVSVVFDSLVAGGLEGAAALETVARSRLIEDQRLELERTAQSLRDWGAAAVTVRVVWDAAAYRGILGVADEWHPTLLVVGAHERRALQTSLTDTHWRLIHACSCPLLLVKQSASNDRRTILAAVDPSRAESRAVATGVLRAARRFGTALNCQVRAVHAFPEPERFALASAVQVSPGVFYGTENIAALHRRGVEELASAHGIDASHTDVRPGEPAEVIRQLMAEHDVRLLVLGLSRHSRVQQVVLGSITQAVTSESPCDVLLIPQPSPDSGDRR
jgi:nucleotide-binding universal stress UspA family protein